MARNNKDELIRQAAIRVFAREGFHRARMETIAHEAGVAVGT
ncbi:TetR family transcriptional regulator, partial [Candidatus Bipolaricaulota bacterium]|nr:TetR family transcriptional regulator [Candidatus Bipolaricaulota bacterium]